MLNKGNLKQLFKTNQTPIPALTDQLNLNNELQTALDVAKRVHATHTRTVYHTPKDPKRAPYILQEPYIAHPLRVAVRVNKTLGWGYPNKQRELLVKVALLHDTLEDVAPTDTAFLSEYLAKQNDDTLTNCLEALTIKHVASSREEYEKMYVTGVHGAVMSDHRVLLVKMSDTLDNVVTSIHNLDVLGKHSNPTSGSASKKYLNKYLKLRPTFVEATKHWGKPETDRLLRLVTETFNHVERAGYLA